MKPIIIPVENGKVIFTLAEFRKYMEEAYDQGYRDGCNTSSLSSYPNTDNPRWWRDVYCNISATTKSDTTPEAILTNSTITEVKGELDHA